MKIAETMNVDNVVYFTWKGRCSVASDIVYLRLVARAHI